VNRPVHASILRTLNSKVPSATRIATTARLGNTIGTNTASGADLSMGAIRIRPTRPDYRGYRKRHECECAGSAIEESESHGAIRLRRHQVRVECRDAAKRDKDNDGLPPSGGSSAVPAETSRRCSVRRSTPGPGSIRPPLKASPAVCTLTSIRSSCPPPSSLGTPPCRAPGRGVRSTSCDRRRTRVRRRCGE
jgi:hypothetical protein